MASYHGLTRSLVGFKLSVVAPRSRHQIIISIVAACLVILLPTSPTLGQLKLPLQDWLDSNLLAIEVPLSEFCKRTVYTPLQRLVTSVKARGVHILLMIPQGKIIGRRCSQPGRVLEARERQLQRWNDWPYSPFQLAQVCMCNFAERHSDFHCKYYVGATFALPQLSGGNRCAKPVACQLAPHTPAGIQQGLCGVIADCSHALLPLLGGTGSQLAEGPSDNSACGALTEGYTRECARTQQCRIPPEHVAASQAHRDDILPSHGGASADTRLAIRSTEPKLETES